MFIARDNTSKGLSYISQFVKNSEHSVANFTEFRCSSQLPPFFQIRWPCFGFRQLMVLSDRFCSCNMCRFSVFMWADCLIFLWLLF
jgi:hypothetical protein